MGIEIKGERRRRLPPEVRAEQRALQVRLEVDREPDLVLIKEKHGFFRYLQPIDGRERADSWVPKYNADTGDVYVTRWHDPTRVALSADGTKRRYVPVPKGTTYLQLKKPEWIRGEVDLSRIPERWVVASLTPQRHTDIESALRQQDEVTHDYGEHGPEYERVEAISMQIRLLTNKYIAREVTTENLRSLQSDVNGVLDVNGLLHPTDETLKAISDKLTRAATRDSLARINPGRARLILGSAHVHAASREVALRHSGEKSARIYSLLLAEREIERANLRAAKRFVDSISGFDGGGQTDRIFDEKSPFSITDSEVTRFREEKLSQISLVLRMVRVNPYFQIARISDLLLAGVYTRSTRDTKVLTATVKEAGLEGLVNAIRGRSYGEGNSVDDLIRQKNPYYARRMLYSISSLIGDCLSDDSLNDVKVF